MATIRRIPSVEHNFQLVVTRVYEEEELLEDEDGQRHAGLRPENLSHFC